MLSISWLSPANELMVCCFCFVLFFNHKKKAMNVFLFLKKSCPVFFPFIFCQVWDGRWIRRVLQRPGTSGGELGGCWGSWHFWTQASWSESQGSRALVPLQHLLGSQPTLWALPERTPGEGLASWECQRSQLEGRLKWGFPVGLFHAVLGLRGGVSLTKKWSPNVLHNLELLICWLICQVENSMSHLISWSKCRPRGWRDGSVVRSTVVPSTYTGSSQLHTTLLCTHLWPPPALALMCTNLPTPATAHN